MKKNPAVPCPKCHAAAGEPLQNYNRRGNRYRPARRQERTAGSRSRGTIGSREERATTLQPIEAPRLARAIDALRRRSAGLPIVAIAWAHGRYAAIGPR